MSDTLNDEITADHWKVEQDKMLNQVMDEIEEMKDDPEGWAIEVEEGDIEKDSEGKDIPREISHPRKVKMVVRTNRDRIYLTQGSNYMMDGFHFDTEYEVLKESPIARSERVSKSTSGMIPLDSSVFRCF